jgi:hypothetical protein
MENPKSLFAVARSTSTFGPDGLGINPFDPLTLLSFMDA